MPFSHILSFELIPIIVPPPMLPNSFRLLIPEFQTIVGRQVVLPDEYREALIHLCRHLDNHQLRSRTARRRSLLAHINRKFSLNRKLLRAVYAQAAAIGITFNYHQKRAIQRAFDTRDFVRYREALNQKTTSADVQRQLSAIFQPLPDQETLRAFRQELAAPSKLRRAKGNRPIGRDILLAALSTFVFSSASRRVLHSHF